MLKNLVIEENSTFILLSKEKPCADLLDRWVLIYSLDIEVVQANNFSNDYIHRIESWLSVYKTN